MSITVGKSVKIIARLENSGEPVIANINMVETTGLGSLTWADRETGTVLVEEEKTEVINDIVGQSQCVLSVTPESVVSIKLMDSEGVATGSDLAVPASSYGRTIDLNIQLATGTELLASYYKGGSVQNEMLGLNVGTARVIVSTKAALEKGLSQTVEIEIVAKTTPGGGGGSNNYENFELSGPGVLNWSLTGYYYPATGGFNQVPNAGGIEYMLVMLSRWTLLRKWMIGGTGTPNGHDVSPFITHMTMTGSGLVVLATGPYVSGNMGGYAVGKPSSGGLSLTVTADYVYGDKRGTVTKSVTLGL
jgi:hypothetical protein